MVHQVRHSLRYVSCKQRKELAGDLRLIYSAATLSQAEQEQVAFGAKWDEEALFPKSTQLGWSYLRAR